MKTRHLIGALLLVVAVSSMVVGRSSDKPVTISIIPKPAQMEVHTGDFTINAKTKVVYFRSNKEMATTVEQFIDRIRTATGFNLAIADGFDVPKGNFIFFNYIHADELGDEGYRLDVEKNRITIGANADAGFFHAVQSLYQLLPPEIFSEKIVKGAAWRIPAVSIIDKPRFQWRGMHLDVSRHFFPKEFIKTYIDMIAMHKMNTFHWHLTDDQGWRIEIKKYPRLTDIGAWRVDRENRDWGSRDSQKVGEKATYGGFYTQEEIKEIIRYAADRHITIVPEIEMPAHCIAALAAYPQFSCTGGPFKVPPGSVWPDDEIYCAGNDSTFLFLQNILSEVIDLFPGKFIHVGGDEAGKAEWKKCPKCQARMKAEGLKDESELQSYFIKRIEKFLISRHRRLIGWDEILEGGLAPEATVMSWRGTDGGIAAARAGHDVVMTPGSHCYFDYYQGTRADEPQAIGGYIPISKVYQYEPIPDSLTGEQAAHILGAQANVWSEYIPTPEHAEYMTMPRMAAMAEVLWSPKERRDWNEFVPRVEQQMKRYEAANYNYARSAYLVSIGTASDSMTKSFGVTLTSEMKAPDIRYSLDGSDPAGSSTRYAGPFSIAKTATIKAAAFREGKLSGKITQQSVSVHKALYKSIVLKYPYKKYEGGGASGLVNGIRGSKSFGDGNWQGYERNDLEAVIDLGDTIPINKITSGYLQDTKSWIFYPTSVEYLVSDDGTTFISVGRFEQAVATAHEDASTKDFTKELSVVHARYIKVIAKNIGTLPEWHVGKGDKAWLFVDEIIVE